jgi:peptide deformylase
MSILDTIEIAALTLVKYPDPRLREVCEPVTEFDHRLRALVEKMLAIMYGSNGVGLAAPQAGVALRLFVANPTMEPDDERVYVNPELIANSGSIDGEEGCLSFPTMSCRVKRYATTTIRAQDLDGNTFEETGEDMLARIFQHESDHLDGRLLVDRISPVAKIANRRLLKDLEAAFAS